MGAWSSRIMRQYDADVREAEQLAHVQGMYKEDIREREEAIKRLQEKYKLNKYAMGEFKTLLDKIKGEEAKAKKRPRGEESVRQEQKGAYSGEKAIHPDTIYEHPVAVDERPPRQAPQHSDQHVESKRREGTLDDVVVEIINPRAGTNVLLLEQKEETKKPFSTLLYFGKNNIIDLMLQEYKEAGVIGEEKNLVIATLCIANGLHHCMEGPSGSGKSKVIGAVMELVEEGDVYRLEFASETAVMNDVEIINKKRIMYIPEFQKAYIGHGGKVPMLAEIIKGMTEGRDVTRRVTVKQGTVAEYTVNAGHTIITTLAFENLFKYDEETARRLIRIEADTSEEHKMMVRAAKAEEAFSKGREQRDETRRETLRAYMHDLIHHHDEITAIDPFSAYMQQYIPLTQRSASFQTHYNNLVAASARFNQNARYACEGQGKTIKTVFTTLQDQQLIFDIYYPQMLAAMERLDKKDEDQSKIKEVRERLEKENGVNWTACLADAKRRMQEVYPQHTDRWEEQMRYVNT